MIMLEDLGYTSFFASHAQEYISQGFLIARVTAEHRQRYTIRNESVEIPAEVAGRIMYTAESRKDYPAVGDWITATIYDNQSHAIIQNILPRRTILERKAAGKVTKSQIIATNVDCVFIVQALDREFNAGSLERHCIVVRESGASGVILLSKRDLCSPVILENTVRDAKTVAGGFPVVAYSSRSTDDIHQIANFIYSGSTFCFIGPSGAGKSTLINALVGHEVLATGEVRDYDAKGRHTTSGRELILREHGGVLIDTPGIRELGLWHTETAVDDTFEDIESLSEKCFFRDCTHIREPKCAVRKAVDDGELSEERYDDYCKFQKELGQLESHVDPKIAKQQKERDKKHNKQLKQKLRQKRHL